MPIEPPPAYVHPYRGELAIVWGKDFMDVQRLCGQLSAGRLHVLVDACAVRGHITGHRAPLCVVVLPRGSPALAALRRHELAHCNGWPADHRR